MNVILFGATGMIGRGVLRECLRDDSVESVLAVGRTPLGVSHPKLRERVQEDPSDLSAPIWTSPPTTPASSASASPPSG
ncbi:hypothetical protein AB0D54_37870 [Streptomyces xanthophaeus]|uniref:hypothetical protein n=1 Tax=Streptomyces xanthophaeus TaxID=67385 RepID=UPI0034377A04